MWNNQNHFELEKNDIIELDLDIFLFSVLLSLSLLLVLSDWLLVFCTILFFTCSCNITCRSTSHSSSCWDRVTFCCTASMSCEFTWIIACEMLGLGKYIYCYFVHVMQLLPLLQDDVVFWLPACFLFLSLLVLLQLHSSSPQLHLCYSRHSWLRTPC